LTTQLLEMQIGNSERNPTNVLANGIHTTQAPFGTAAS
jgi:hypothetical protein